MELELVEAVLLIDVELKLAVIDAMIDSFNFFFWHLLQNRKNNEAYYNNKPR